jgi:hypothetical protein
MVCIDSAEGVFNKISPAFSERLEFSKEEFLTQPCVDFVHKDDQKPTINNMEPITKRIPIIKF